MARRGEKRTRPKRSPRVQVMHKLFRLYERAERLEARAIARLMRMPMGERPESIARQVQRARQLNERRWRAARAVIRSMQRGRPA
jgi:hypothetical protein